MRFRFILIFSFIFYIFEGNAQQTLSEIKYKAWDIHALRYYPFTQPADSFMMQVISRNHILNKDTTKIQYEKTAADLAINKQFLADAINSTTASQNQIFKHAVYPYGNWLNYARSNQGDSMNMNLSLFLSQRYNKEKQQEQSSVQSPLEWIGKENIRYGLEQWIGNFDIWKEQNNVLFLSIKSPLAKDAGKTYQYFFSSRTEIDGIQAYEIVFFPKKTKTKAFEGYLYISVKDLSPVKAVFTLNPKLRKAPAKEILFIQTPAKKETLLTIGDELSMGLLINQVRFKDNQSPDSILTLSQKENSGLVEEARNTHAYKNVQNGISFLFTDHIGIFKDHFNLGPVTQMLSYNYMEGLRLRVSGFTSEKISSRAAAGGYLAYGTKDERWKYRGDFILTPRSTYRFQLTYVNDLNIPGQNCLDDKRDRIYYSLYQSNTANMSLQKIGQLSFATDGFHGFSLKLHAKYLYDQPVGVVKYETANATINNITTSEIGASLRFSPNEKFVWVKGKRIVFHSPDVDVRVNQQIGLKGIFGSDYNYRITDASISKKFDFPLNAGSFDFRLSGGKVWNTVPFPLLFIPEGNQSYIYDSDSYNLMRFYEFTTDRFVAGNAGVHLNWTPVKLFRPKSKLKTHLGMKALYGPLSDKNNPQLHPELFIFNNGVEPLGGKPYTEANIGLSGILKFLRIDYVYRFAYGHRGSLFLSTVLNF